VRDNLRIAAALATEDSMIDALRQAGMRSWLQGAPEGLATVLGERGRALSSGERQRLAIARAILANPRVLVLDEATGALDVATEGALLEALRPWLSRRTVVCITHRPAVAAMASRVIRLRDGTVAAGEGSAA
jgi:ABC-type multidrug transport system fused ATPase/permease subunit